LAARALLGFFGAPGLEAFFMAGALVAGLTARVLVLAAFVDATDLRFTAGAALAFFAAGLGLAAAVLRAGFAAVFFAVPVFLAGEPAFPSPRRLAPRFDFAMSLALESCGDATACYSVVVPAGQPILWRARQAPFILGLTTALTRVLLFLIALYKRLLSPLLGARCRFHPSCSTYARIAIARFGPLRGGLLAAWRILRCQPLCEGGLDPVPESFTLPRCRSHGEH
jgi:putative membrane protein insertion efficiency factor